MSTMGMVTKSLPLEALHPVSFNGEDLPLAAYWLELLGPILKTLPSDTSDWLLDLHYCGGKERTLSSVTVLAHCQSLNARLVQNREEILRALKERIPQCNPDQMFNDWLLTLGIIRSSALTQDKCVWMRPSFVDKEKAAKMLEFLDENTPD
jgi:hypothetical protein